MTAESTMQAHLAQAAAEANGFDDAVMDFDAYHDSSIGLEVFATDDHTTISPPLTVSPNDLSYSHDVFSRPNSATTTFLATPSLLDDESPYLDSYNTSPALTASNFGSGTLPPLFPTDEYAPATTCAAPVTKPQQDVESSLLRGLAMSRTTSSRSINDEDSVARRDLLRQRLSITAGIAKSSRRQSKLLHPIEVETGDETAMKRAKNTMAARKSRQKKKDEVAQLEAQLLDMMEERDYYKMLAIKHGAPMPESPSACAMSPGA